MILETRVTLQVRPLWPAEWLMLTHGSDQAIRSADPTVKIMLIFPGGISRTNTPLV